MPCTALDGQKRFFYIYDPSFINLDAIPACDGRTDG